MGTVGKDFSRYAEWMDGQAVDRRYVMELEDQYTASAFIITDLDDNQITAFHPGAMDLCHLGEVPSDQGIRFGVVSPEGREACSRTRVSSPPPAFRTCSTPGRARRCSTNPS